MDQQKRDIENLNEQLALSRRRDQRRDLSIQLAEKYIGVSTPDAAAFAQATLDLVKLETRRAQASNAQQLRNESARYRAYVVLFTTSYNSERVSEWLPRVHEAIAFFEQVNDKLRAATARQKLAFYCVRSFDFVQARALYEQDLEYLREHSEHRALAAALNGLAQIALREAKHEEALRLFTQGRIAAETIGETRFLIAMEVGLGSVHQDLSHFDQAKEHYQRALQLSDEEHMPQQTASIHIGLSTMASMDGDFAGAIRHCERAIHLSRLSNDGYTETAALELASGAWLTLGDEARALDLLHQLETRARNMGSTLRQAGSHNLMASIYAKRKEYEQALHHFSEACTLFDLLQEPRGQCYTRANIAQTHYDLGNIDQANVFVQDALQRARSASFEDLVFEILPIHCAIALRQGSSSLVVSELEHGRKRSQDLQHARGYALLTKCLADCALAANREQQALALYQECFEGAKSIGDLEQASSVAECCARVHEGRSDFKTAYYWKVKCQELEHRYINERSERTARNMIILLETERFQKERDQLLQQNELLQKENEFKQKELSAMALHLVHKNEVLEQLKLQARKIVSEYSREAHNMVDEMLHHINQALRDDASWESFQQQFSRIHSNFAQELSERYPKLTPMELKICSLLKIQLNTKEIAAALVLSPRTVEDHRNRLRKKFGLEKDHNLSTFLSSLG